METTTAPSEVKDKSPVLQVWHDTENHEALIITSVRKAPDFSKKEIHELRLNKDALKPIVEML